MSSWQKTQATFYADPKKHTHLLFNPKSAYAKDLSDHMASALQLEGSENVLEIGCGAGRFSFHLSDHCGKLTGLDAASSFLDLLKSLSGLGKTIDTICGDIHNLSHLLPEAELDDICGFFILHHLEDHDRLFQSFYQALGRGGKVAFVEPNRFNPLFLLQVLFSPEMTWQAEKGMFSFSANRAADLLKKNGFTNIQCHSFGFFPPAILDFAPKPLLAFQKFLEEKKLFKKILPFTLLSGTKP